PTCVSGSERSHASFFFSSRRRHTRWPRDWSSDVCSSDLGIKAKPTVVTPNQAEAERLLNTALLTRNHFVQATERIRALGAETVILSLGSRGAMAAFDHRMMEALAPRIDAVSPIVAGDAMA